MALKNDYNKDTGTFIKYSYVVEGYDMENDRIPFQSTWRTSPNLEYVAEDAAEHYFKLRSGYEVTWPLEFSIFSGTDGNLLGTFLVELDYEPVFNASRRK